jgi:hypothetical protein
MRNSRIDAESVRQAVSLIELLPADANPRRVGRDAYQALCSFHDEKNRSMSVRLTPSGWRYRCFACGESGGVVDYFMATRKVDFKTAVRELSGGRDLSFTPKKRRRPGFLVVCSECPGRADIDADDVVHLMVYRAPDLGWLVEEHRALCPACVEKRLSDPYHGGQQTMFRRAG